MAQLESYGKASTDAQGGTLSILIMRTEGISDEEKNHLGVKLAWTEFHSGEN